MAITIRTLVNIKAATKYPNVQKATEQRSKGLVNVEINKQFLYLDNLIKYRIVTLDTMIHILSLFN